jgi:hypothetical protein
MPPSTAFVSTSLPLTLSPSTSYHTTTDTNCDQTAYIIKWAVIGAIFVACLAFFLGGYLHAKSRMKKGLAPLAYHRVRLFPLSAPLPPLLSSLTHPDSPHTTLLTQFQWLIPRRHRLAFHHTHPHLPNPYASDPSYNNAAYYPGYGDTRAHHHGYAMGPMTAPPAYGQEEWVPAYSPPEGGSKVAPDQNGGVVGVREVGGQQQGGQGVGQGHPGGDLGQIHVRQ